MNEQAGSRFVAMDTGGDPPFGGGGVVGQGIGYSPGNAGRASLPPRPGTAGRTAVGAPLGGRGGGLTKEPSPEQAWSTNSPLESLIHEDNNKAPPSRRLPPRTDPVSKMRGIGGKDGFRIPRSVPAKYMCQGGGRDLYLADKWSATGFQPSSVPPKTRMPCVPPKPITVPKYHCSGSGRDTFIDLQPPKVDFKLRDYEIRGLGLRYGSEPALRPTLQGFRKAAAKKIAQKQRSNMERLSKPKTHAAPADPWVGTIPTGKWLRPSSSAPAATFQPKNTTRPSAAW